MERRPFSIKVNENRLLMDKIPDSKLRAGRNEENAMSND